MQKYNGDEEGTEVISFGFNLDFFFMKVKQEEALLKGVHLKKGVSADLPTIDGTSLVQAY